MVLIVEPPFKKRREPRNAVRASEQLVGIDRQRRRVFLKEGSGLRTDDGDGFLLTSFYIPTFALPQWGVGAEQPKANRMLCRDPDTTAVFKAERRKACRGSPQAASGAFVWVGQSGNQRGNLRFWGSPK